MAGFTVVVASGKGGTGKTLVATRLARRLAEVGRNVAYVDTDVEAPNGHLALNATITATSTVTRSVAAIHTDACRACGDCVGACAFGALFLSPDGAIALPEHCRDCRACELVCRRGAIHRETVPVGELASGQAGALRFFAGTLRLGEQRGVPLVEALRARANAFEIAVIDSPPGSACSAVAALRDADFAILVTEPTPFGEHDLRLASQLCRSLGVEAVGVLNRAGLGASSQAGVVAAVGLEQWAEIPYDPAIAAAVAAGEDPELASPALAQAVTVLCERVLARVPSAGTLSAGGMS